MAKRHSRPSVHYRYEHYDPRLTSADALAARGTPAL
jgi:hypothetical protein